LYKKRRTQTYWIQHAVHPRRKGQLREKVFEQYGKKGFDSKDRIKPSVLAEMKKTADPRTRQQIQFAQNVRGLS
jgi:hypothetical protein